MNIFVKNLFCWTFTANFWMLDQNPQMLDGWHCVGVRLQDGVSHSSELQKLRKYNALVVEKLLLCSDYGDSSVVGRLRKKR